MAARSCARLIWVRPKSRPASCRNWRRPLAEKNSSPDGSRALLEHGAKQIPRRMLGISAAGSDARKAPQLSGDHTARVTPVPIPNTEVKPRRADGTARETVWERESSPE